MILFFDYRSQIPHNQRLPIVELSSTQRGDHWTIVNEDWYANPVIPLDVPLHGIFPDFIKNERALKGYIQSLIRGYEIDTSKPIYLSTIKSNLDIMDSRYEQYKIAQQKRLAEQKRIFHQTT